MRCKNCGWPNKPNEKVCVKCHAPLDTEPDDDTFGGINGSGASDKPLNKTVLEDEVLAHQVLLRARKLWVRGMKVRRRALSVVILFV